MKIIFLGTPDFAVPSLKAIASSKHQIMAVVSQPDRKGNRNKLLPTPVKLCASELGLTVLQYEKISRDGVEELKALNADIMITCAFGQILSNEILNLTPYGVINVHASLLPKYRGSSPIQWSVINGEKITGVTIMQTAKTVDSGDIIMQTAVEIGAEETSGELFDRLSVIGAKALLKTLDDIESNKYTKTPQVHTLATHCAMLKKSDGLINFNTESAELKCFVRGMNPWPCAFSYLNNEVIKIYKISDADDVSHKGFIAGSVIVANAKQGLIVATANGAVRLCEVQLANNKKMADTDYLCGHQIESGTVLGVINE